MTLLHELIASKRQQAQVTEQKWAELEGTKLNAAQEAQRAVELSQARSAREWADFAEKGMQNENNQK